MRKDGRFISREKQVFLVGFSSTFPRFPRKKKPAEKLVSGRTYFIVNALMIKTIRLMQIMIATGRKRPSKKEESSDSNTGKLPTANSCHIAFFSVFPPFFSDPLLLFSRYEKKLLQSIYDTKQ